MNSISVSVVIPALGRESLLRRAIASAKSQSFAPSEIIVVDDGSSPPIRLTNIVTSEEMGVSVRLVRHGTTLGAQSARNSGIRAAVNEWVAFLDSDDYWLSDKLERQLRTIEEATDELGLVPIGVLGNGLMRTNGNVDVPIVTKHVPLSACQELLRGGVALFPSMLVRRDALEDMGMLNEEVVSFHEWDTALRLCQVGLVVYSSDVVFVWDRTQGPSISVDGERDVAGFLQVIQNHAARYRRTFGSVAYLQALAWNLRRRRSDMPVRAFVRLIRRTLWAAASGINQSVRSRARTTREKP
jgi:glycosyltransferase involved in cell wall biosynthesis